MASIFKRRRAELSAIYRCRLSFLVLASLMIVAYLVIQIDDIVKEIPSIRVSYNESDSLPMPGYFIFISSPYLKPFPIKHAINKFIFAIL